MLNIMQESHQTASINNQPAKNERLVIVSNREPYSIEIFGKEIRVVKTPGGLVTALDPILRKRNGLWICWEGASKKTPEADDLANFDENLDWDSLELPYHVESVLLTESEINHYYYGYANARIWPLFHYFLSRCNFFDEQDWPSYLSANQKFANAIIENTTDDDMIWVQDYHLLLVPAMVREKAVNRKIGFFLHIPFPSVEVFKVLPKRTDVLRGMLGSDLIGFHVAEYVEHFLDTIEKLLPPTEVTVDWENSQILYNGRVIQVNAFPISIDFNQIDDMASREDMCIKASSLRSMYNVDNIVLSIDRLDYTKGIPESLEAIRVFFEKYPEYKKRLSFVQIAAPTRTEVPEYQKMKEEIDQAVGRINGELAEDNWVPITYFYRSFPLDEIIPYFIMADMAMITPLRDGMNLVAKEYCAAKTDLNGVLMLSEFTGAASELNQALLVNPFYIEHVADMIYQAINLPIEFKMAKMLSLREQIRKNDIHNWVESFIESFQYAIQNR